MITEKTLKEESINKNHYDDNYSAPFAMHALSLLIYLPAKLNEFGQNFSSNKNEGAMFNDTRTTGARLRQYIKRFKSKTHT